MSLTTSPQATTDERTLADADRMRVHGELENRFDEVLTPGALAFLTRLHDRFAPGRAAYLQVNADRQAAVDAGETPDFLEETRAIREDDSWRVAGAGPGLEDRRVEVTGPTDRKMTVNALNSGAQVWLADGEDALSPTWHNVIRGQINLYDGIRHQIDFVSDEGKEYKLGESTPTIVFRPRGWHLNERHLSFHDQEGQAQSASGSLVDVGLYLFHNAHELIARGRGPYFYLPKLENRLGARLWNEVFSFAEEELGLEHGTIRATVLIETLPAAFEMEEILYELRDHCAGLNAGRWDYLFSIIKTFRNRGREWMLPDRRQLTMTVPFMRAYTELLVTTCHRRGAHAIGGMSAFIPNRREPEVTARALEQVGADKRREAQAGFDGSWVAHPDLIPTARAEFDAVLGEAPNQLQTRHEHAPVTASELLDFRIEGGEITREGVQQNIAATLHYLESWLRGTGAVAIDNLMEDAATAEISRSQLWQWMRQGAICSNGKPVIPERVEWLLERTLEELPRSEGDRYDDAAELFREIVFGEEYAPFLTKPAYCRYLSRPSRLETAQRL